MPINSLVLQQEAIMLWEKISKLMNDSVTNSSPLNTIQIVLPNHSDPNFKQFKWFILSRSLESYKQAMYAFTGLTIDGNSHPFNRTLIINDYDKNAYWYDEWNAQNTTEENPAHLTKLPKFFSDYGNYKVDHAEQEYDLENKLKTWRSCLECQFPYGGSTLWVTQLHTLRGHEGRKIVSSAFCVFNKDIDETTRFRISKILREYIIDHLLEIYEIHILEGHKIYAEQFANYLRAHDDDLFLCQEVKEQIKSFLPVIQGCLPILIEGPQGCGKLSMAKHLVSISPNLGHDDTIRSNHTECIKEIIDCKEAWSLTKLKEIFNDLFDQIGSSKYLIVTVDNLEFLDLPLQAYLVSILENYVFSRHYSNSQINPPHFIFTIAPDASSALRSKNLSPDLYIRLSAFRIKLPSLQQRLLSLNVIGRNQLMKDIISTINDKLRPLLPDRKLKSLDEKMIEEFAARPWPGNYLEVRQELLHLQLLAKDSVNSIK